MATETSSFTNEEEIIFFNNNLNDDNNSIMLNFLHPLDTTPLLIEKENPNNYIPKTELEPELLKLIELCKIQEEKRKQEEHKVRLKEYQILCHLQQQQQQQQQQQF